QEDDEEYEEFTRKKQKVSGNASTLWFLAPAVVLSENLSCPPCALAGSVEEQWHLQILAKGRVTCPTCRAVVRKTVAGLRKHMAKCRQEMFTCHHCGKQLRSLAGMKYHIMADHNSLPVVEEGGELDEQGERNRLRKVLKRMGKLKCTREVSCRAFFTSIMGYLYHSKKCGKVASELEKMALKCHHCGKAYKSKAGLVYHLRSEHGPVTFLHENGRPESRKEMKVEPPPPHAGGRVQRKSAKVAIYYLHELASEELAKEWPKKKVLQDLVPDDRKLKYTRPGLPTFSQEVLCKWKSELKMHRRVHCPNQGESLVSGQGAALGALGSGPSDSGLEEAASTPCRAQALSWAAAVQRQLHGAAPRSPPLRLPSQPWWFLAVILQVAPCILPYGIGSLDELVLLRAVLCSGSTKLLPPPSHLR
uniref:Zinc finger protein 512 n=1 Tax=Sphenodon punctatus TaxID=8508 RepID=A0A8D0HD97_SPHPU